MGKNEENMKWLPSQVEEEHYNSMMELSAEMGIHVSKVVREAILQFIVSSSKKTKSSRVRVAAEHIEGRAKQLQRNQLRQLIVMYQEYPEDEEMLDRINCLCDESGVSMQSLVDDLTKMPQVAEILKDGTGDAELWLAKHMSPDKPLSVNSIYKAAYDDLKIRDHVVRDARTRINRQGGVHISSKRIKGLKGWYWLLTLPED